MAFYLFSEPMNRTFRIVSTLIVILVAVYFLGPMPDFGPINNAPKALDIDLDKLESFVAAQQPLDVLPGNAGEIVWADSVRKTEYSMVYLHGFSASAMEGDPIHKNLAKRFGCNLYIPLQVGHGQDDEDAFKGLTPDAMVESAKEAIAIGKLLGEKVIVFGTSTGCTYGIYLTPEDPAVEALVLLSPNIEIYDPTAFLLDMPWGKQIAGLVIGSEYRTVEYPKEVQPYWYSRYHIDGLIALQRLLDESMTSETFATLDKPVFMGYYYKNEQEMDHVVSVEAMHDFFEEISTPEDQKKAVAFADGTEHVLGSSLKNPNWKHVQEEVVSFLETQVFKAP